MLLAEEFNLSEVFEWSDVILLIVKVRIGLFQRVKIAHALQDSLCAIGSSDEQGGLVVFDGLGLPIFQSLFTFLISRFHNSLKHSHFFAQG